MLPSSRRRVRLPAALGLVLALSALPARAAAAEEPVLELAHRNLQGNQVGIDAFGGSFLGGSVGHSYAAGARVTYYPIRQLGIGAAYIDSRVFNGRNLDGIDDRGVHVVHGQLELPLVSALRLGRHHLVQMDMFGELGGGAIRVADDWRGLAAIGGGVRIYPRIRWLGFRVDVLTLLHETGTDEGVVFDGDVAFTLGLSFVLPPRRHAAR